MNDHASGRYPDADRPFDEPGDDSSNSPPRRTYLAEPGWRIGVKLGSTREFCYMQAPGQDFYHRLCDNELYLQRDEEKLCMACAARRGLLTHEPRRLRETNLAIPVDQEAIPLDLGWRDKERLL